MNDAKLYTSEEYVRFRPGYPPALFDFVLSLTTGRGLAWDCATGSGQCAQVLARDFAQVVATDIDAEQIAHAPRLPNIAYHVAGAAPAPLESASADLVTVATAAHWLPHAEFYPEVERVLAPSGLLAVWSYADPVIDAAVDRVSRRLFFDILGSWWPKGMEFNLDRYRSLPFPYAELPAPAFAITTEWNRRQYEGFIRSCSGYRAFRQAEQGDPLVIVREELTAAWPAEGGVRQVTFPLWGKFGRKAP